MYRENIMDHYKRPRNFGELGNPTVSRHESNPSCGDDTTFYLVIEDGKVKDVKFSGDGCAISVAGSSMLSEELIGMNVEDVIKFPKEDMLEMIGPQLSTMRVKCALLGLHTVKKALCQYLGQREEGEW